MAKSAERKTNEAVTKAAARSTKSLTYGRAKVTDRDIALKVVGDGKDPRSASVRDIMTPNPARISVDKDLHDLTTLMHALHVRRMPIVDGGGKAVGIVTLDDLIVLFADEMWEMGKTVSETFFHKAA